MNSVIEQALAGLEVDGVQIPVAFLFYDGHDEPYITYQQTDADNSYSSDDDLQAYVDYYDFDIYSKSDYTYIIKLVKLKLKEVGFTFEPSRSSGDMYETDTGYYHKTLCFAIERSD